MRPVFLLASALCLLGISAFAEDRRPAVVVELFTSESCSNCPPADEMLDRLEHTVSGVRVIALEEHIDYWNNSAWTDRFSAPIFHARQNDYALFFRNDTIYTPQMVVNGHVQFVADDASRAAYEIKHAITGSQYTVSLQPQRNGKDSALTDLAILIHNNQKNDPVPADVYLAISEDRLTSNVQNGENAGRSLRHGPVVRSFGVIGNIAAKPFNEVGLKSTLKIPPDWKSDNLHAVVFIQERRSHQITAAAVASLRN